MIVRSLSLFARRVFTVVVIGTVAVPTAALADGPVAKTVAANVAPTSQLKVKGLAIATAVAERNPVGEGLTFDASTGALYAWVKVKNLGAETTITMVWKREGNKKLSVSLPVGYSYGWKTWSKKGISGKDAGNWSVEVLDAAGVLLETTEFQVTSDGSVGMK